MISSVSSDDVAVFSGLWPQSGFLSSSVSFSPFPPKQLELSSSTIPQSRSVYSLPIKLVLQSSRSTLALSPCKLRMGDATIVYSAITYATITSLHSNLCCVYYTLLFTLYLTYFTGSTRWLLLAIGLSSSIYSL